HRYTTTLGPLGLRTLMHDQNWARRYKLAMTKFPEVLKDVHGPLRNALEIVHVHKNGPAHDYIKKGDLILEMEGQALKSAQWMNFDNKYSSTANRGLEMHAGQMIDKAEGRGKIKLKILRLPKEFKMQPLAARTEKFIKDITLESNISSDISIALPEVQYLSIKSDKFSKIILTGSALVNEQGVKVPLHKLDRGTVFKNSFWNMGIDIKNHTWRLQGPFHFQFVLPPGKWKLVGNFRNHGKNPTLISFGHINNHTLPDLERYCKTVEFEIPRIGSFGDSFDPYCNKVRNYSATLAKRLATQQTPDGSWPAVHSYTSAAFYTSMCGLGLLAENNPIYNKHVRKAAHYVAYSGAYSSWSWARGINAMFLGEYYLRTKDKSILSGLSLALKRCEQALVVGYVAGHHSSNPGYGGDGQISGSGTIACALAIAEHTPATFTRGTAAKMMARIQSLCVYGTVPYGRSTARGTKIKTFNLDIQWGGQTGTAGTAPYYMAGKISGGSSYFNEIVSRRFLKPPYGDVDGGHATHTIPYTLGSIAISLCSPEAHKKNMSAFLWKLTTHRGFDGFIVNNANPMEHHTGEAIMGKPWWSTGAYLIMMNAHKRNMAMTGQEQYMAKSQKKLPLILDADLKVYRQVLRQWSTVEAALGKKTPRSISTAINNLLALKKDANYGMKVIYFLKKNSLKCARDLANMRLEDQLLKNYCVEIILGVNHDIHLDQHNWHHKKHHLEYLANKAKTEGRQKEYEKQAQIVTLKINSSTYFTNCNGVLPMTKESDNPLPEFVSQGELRIRDKNGRTVEGLPKLIKLDNNKLQHVFTLPKMKGIDKLYAHFTYTCAGININYQKVLVINREKGFWNHSVNIRSLWVPGTLKDTFNGWRVDIILPKNRIYNGTFHNHPPPITDSQGKPFKDYILRWGGSSANFPLILPLVKGNRAKFLISMGTKYEGLVHEVRLADPFRTTIKNISYKLNKGSIENKNDHENKLEYISDHDPDTNATIISDSDGQVELEFSCNKTSISKIYCLLNKKREDKLKFKAEYFHEGSWHVFSTAHLNGIQGFYLNMPFPKSGKFKMTIHADKAFRFHLIELHFLR
ncbi:MAG: hypothetical protein HRT88_12310, partial [Lentisphaeraceae bacterium]|nr:hypothetical protein [Lentisphaeraceae bacterium]